MPTLTSYFNDMDDPRGGNAPRHKFCDLMTISLLCALCGGETAVDMELFGQMKENFLREFLELPHGIPCHDGIFAALPPYEANELSCLFRQVSRGFCNWGWICAGNSDRWQRDAP